MTANFGHLRELFGRLQRVESALRAERLKTHDPSGELAKLFGRLERVEIALVENKLAVLPKQSAGSAPQFTTAAVKGKGPRKSSSVGGVLVMGGTSPGRKSSRASRLKASKMRAREAKVTDRMPEFEGAASPTDDVHAPVPAPVPASVSTDLASG